MNNGIRVTGRSGSSIEGFASGVRRVLLPRAEKTDAVNGLALFEFELEENGPRLTNGARIVTAVEELPSALEAYTQFDAKAGCFRLALSTRSYKRLVDGDSRGTFTLCHEIGHLVLHRGTLKHLGQLPHRELMLTRGENTHRPFEDSEWQANRFASALLMPAAGLEVLRARDRLDEENVSDHFHTSYTASEIRIREFNDKREELLRVAK